MDYLYKTLFGNTFERRKIQLERQELLDRKLSTLPCQGIVVQYLLFQRKMNQKRTLEYENQGIWKSFDLSQKHLDEVDKELLELEKVISTKHPCRSLKEF